MARTSSTQLPPSHDQGAIFANILAFADAGAAIRSKASLPDFSSEDAVRRTVAALLDACEVQKSNWILGRGPRGVVITSETAGLMLQVILKTMSQEEAAAAEGVAVGTLRSKMHRMGLSSRHIKHLGWDVKKVVGNKLTNLETTKLYARHLLGATSKELESHFGLSTSSVQYILDNAVGVKPLESTGSHKTKLKRAVEFARTCSVEEWNTILMTVSAADGDTRQAARALGIDEYRVIEVVKSDAVDAPAHALHSLNPRIITKIVRLRKEGKTLQEVAALTGAEAKTVWRHSQKYGVGCIERDPTGKARAAIDEARGLSQDVQLELLKCLEQYGASSGAWSNYPKGFRDEKARSVLNALLLMHGVERMRNRDAKGSYKRGATFYKGLAEAIEKLESKLAK